MKIFLQANILLLPYNTPGGHSGVLEQAIFFEIPTIAIDFPEYREQVSDSSNVKLVNTESFSSVLATYLKSIGNRQKINIIEKIIIASANVKELIEMVEES